VQATEFDEQELFSAIASLRPKDVDDIAMLEKLKQGGGST
jgi:hypothetical protein